MASSRSRPAAPPNRWRHDEHGHEDGHAVACAARCRQPRFDPRARRAREQPQGHQRRDPEAPAHRVHRHLRLGQELAGVRHDRRGVAAADQRDVQRLRAGLHADAGEARGSGAITVERGAAKAVRKTFTRLGGMCPRCEGMGSVSDMDLTQLFDDSKSLAEGAITIPGFTVDSFWTVRPYIESGILDPDKPIRKYTKKELHDFLHHEPIKVKVNGVNVTYEGLIPKLQKSFLSKDREALQPQIRAFVDRAITFTACPECSGTRLSEGARSSRIGRTNIADACAMQISDLADWVRGVKEPSTV